MKRYELLLSAVDREQDDPETSAADLDLLCMGPPYWPDAIDTIVSSTPRSQVTCSTCGFVMLAVFNPPLPKGRAMKLLMVLTSHDRLGNTGRRDGFLAARNLRRPIMCSATLGSS